MAKLADLPAGRQARNASLLRYNCGMYFVYVLKSLNKNYRYVGLTHDVVQRVARHQTGRERTTRTYRPFQLGHIEKFVTRIEARRREKYLKSGTGKEWLKEQYS